jgi:hypothetical protein
MEQFGNPSSLHGAGAQAAKLLQQSRAAVGEALGERYLKDGQLIFTGSGTEATALALLGTARAKARRVASTILTTDSDRNQTGLIHQKNPPVYRGAVVLTQGADDPAVKLAIVDAVGKATGLGADKIAVLKMK